MMTALALDLAYGAAIGVALGLTGSGGSILTVPALVYLVGEDVHTAIGTSLAIVGGIALEGVLQQRDHVQWKDGLLLGAWGIAGNVPGSLLSAYVPGQTLLLLFSAIMIVASLRMLGSRDGEARAGATAGSPRVVLAAGLGLGFLTGFMGVGGGFLIVPALVLVFGRTMRAAIATSLLVIAFNSAVGLATRFAAASIDWTAAGAFLAGGLAGSAAASMVVHRLDQPRLRRIFAVFILLVGLFTAGSATGLIPIRVK